MNGLEQKKADKIKFKLDLKSREWSWAPLKWAKGRTGSERVCASMVWPNDARQVRCVCVEM
jgi:hypothetical protein